MIVQINKDNSSDYNGWFSEITDAFKNSGNPEIENIVIDTLEAYYAHIEEICSGYITLSGGHRVGICGKAVCSEGKIAAFKEVSSLNFRIANQILGIADGELS